MTIAQIVTAHLSGQSLSYLEDIAAHGIHNITNDFHGADEYQYEEFSAEFDRQAKHILSEIEESNRA